MNVKQDSKRIVIFFLLSLSFGFGQTQKNVKSQNKMEAGFEGIIGLSFSDKILALNVGGPSLKYKISDNYKIGMGAFPSLILFENKVLPRLAFSPIIEHKKWLFIAPYYGYDGKDNMLWTLGVGYKF
jgi:hypothetical protein